HDIRAVCAGSASKSKAQRAKRKALSALLLAHCSWPLALIMAKHQRNSLQRRRIDPATITKKQNVGDLIDESFLAYNAARLREACQLFTHKMLEPDVTVGLDRKGVGWGKGGG